VLCIREKYASLWSQKQQTRKAFIFWMFLRMWAEHIRAWFASQDVDQRIWHLVGQARK